MEGGLIDRYASARAGQGRGSGGVKEYRATDRKGPFIRKRRRLQPWVQKL